MRIQVRDKALSAKPPTSSDHTKAYLSADKINQLDASIEVQLQNIPIKNNLSRNIVAQTRRYSENAQHG